MSQSNLPPGVSESDIPGNRPEDLAWDKFFEKIDVDCNNNHLNVFDAIAVWNTGLSQWILLNRLRKA